MRITLITKEDKTIQQNDVKSVETTGGALHIVLTTGESMDMPMYLVAYILVSNS